MAEIASARAFVSSYILLTHLTRFRAAARKKKSANRVANTASDQNASSIEEGLQLR